MPVINTLYNMLGPIEMAWDIPLNCSNMYVKVVSPSETAHSANDIWFADCIEEANGRPIYVTVERDPEAQGVVPYNVTPYSIKKEFEPIALSRNPWNGALSQLAVPMTDLNKYTSLIPHFSYNDMKLTISREGEMDRVYETYSGMFVHDIANDEIRNTYTSGKRDYTFLYMYGKDDEPSEGLYYDKAKTDSLATSRIMTKRLENGWKQVKYRQDEVDNMWFVLTYYCPFVWNDNPQGIWYITEEGVSITSSVSVDKFSIKCRGYIPNPVYDPVS